MTDYLTDFVQESEERITELNNALLTLERDPTNDDAMESIFRVAHTLKSNCGAMGLESASDLAHAIEDLLDAVRRDEAEVTPELMDVIFDGVDELETMIDEVAADGEIETDPTETIDALRSQLDGEAASAAITSPTTDEIDDVISRFDPPADSEHHAYLARLAIAEREDVNNGQLVIEALIDAFDLIGTEPPREAIAAGDYDGQFDAVFGSAVGERAITSGLEPVEEVDDFELVNVSDRFDAISDADTAAAAVEPTPDPGDGLSSEDAETLEVDELLDEFDEFDNLDEMVDDVADDDLEAFEDMGEAGSFDDLLGEDELADDQVEPSVDDETAATTETTAASADDEDVDDANAVFNELKDEVEMVGFDELQDELDELEFDEFDNDDEVEMDELIGDDIADDDSFLSDTEPTDEAIDDMLVDADDAESTADDSDEILGEDDVAEPTTDDSDDTLVEDDDLTPTADDVDDGLEADAVDGTPVDAGIDAEADAGSDPIAVEPTESEPPSTDPDAADTTAEAADSADTEPATDSTEAEPDPAGAATEPATDSATADPATDETDSDSVEERIDQPADETVSDGLEEIADEPDSVGTDDTLEGEDAVAGDETFEDTVTADDPLEAAAAGDDPLEDAADVASNSNVDSDSTDDFGAAEDEIESTASADEETTEADAEPADDPFDDDSFGDVPFGDDTADDSLAADAEDDSVAANAEEDSVAASSADDPFADDSFGDDFGFDESDGDDEFETVETASSDAEDDEFDAVFDGDDFDDTFGDDDFDDGGFDSSSTTTSSTESTTESFGDEDASTDDDDDIVRQIDEPAFENPELTLPEADDSPDADQQTDEIQSVRVDVEQIDSLLTLVEGLVTSRVRLRHAVTEGEDHSALETELDDLEDLTTDLQETVMDVRLVPLQTVTNRLPRVVRDIAREQDKEVAFEVNGEDVELDRSILDRIGDPLIHLVRNAVDHGIEAPDVRESAEKSPEGAVEVHADRERDRVTITVEDDGSGLDPDRLRSEAVDAEILTENEAAELPDDEAYELIFHPGLSTADEVTDVSGRGVGMDVVKRTIEDLEGTVSIDSEPGAGTSVTMTLPVSVAIDDILFLECGGEEFGVPTKAVLDIEPADRLETVDGQPVLADATDEYPVIELDEALGTTRTGVNGDGMVVRIRNDVRPVALHCDHVHGQQEVVVKPFEGFMSDIPGLSGATVRGRGEVVNILDVTTL